MLNIVVDAGPMIAMFDRDDAHHKQAGEFLRRVGDFEVYRLPRGRKFENVFFGAGSAF